MHCPILFTAILHCKQEIDAAKNDYNAISDMYHNALDDYDYVVAEKRAIASDLIEEYNEIASDEIKYAKATTDTVSYYMCKH
jgi:hypothetical protein